MAPTKVGILIAKLVLLKFLKMVGVACYHELNSAALTVPQFDLSCVKRL